MIGGHLDVRTANPLPVNESFNAETLQHVLFVTLLRYDRDFQPKPYLTESWEFHADTAVTFRIRRDIAWHDGVPTTAHDIAFTYERAKDPETAFMNRDEYFGFWREVEVIDSFSVRFRLEPHSEPLSGWVQMAIAPRHLLGSAPPAELARAPFSREPVGNGPFRFVSQRANDQWVFEANPAFPEELGGRPYVDRLVWRVIPESTARLTALQTGAVHLITNMPSDHWSVLEAQPGLRGLQRESRMFAFVGVVLLPRRDALRPSIRTWWRSCGSGSRSAERHGAGEGPEGDTRLRSVARSVGCSCAGAHCGRGSDPPAVRRSEAGPGGSVAPGSSRADEAAGP